MQELCKLNNYPLFRSKIKQKSKKRVAVTGKNRREVDLRSISQEKAALNRILSTKKSQRYERHICNSSPIKRNIINSTFYKKTRSQKVKKTRLIQPKNKKKILKQSVQCKVVECKSLLADKKESKKSAIRSKSQEPKQQQDLDEIKLKITATVQ